MKVLQAAEAKFQRPAGSGRAGQPEAGFQPGHDPLEVVAVHGPGAPLSEWFEDAPAGTAAKISEHRQAEWIFLTHSLLW